MKIYILGFLIPLVSLSSVANACDDNEVTPILKHAITLNEKFKRSVRDGDDNYKSLRKTDNQYYTKEVIPCLQIAKVILSNSNDVDLIETIMNFTISFENSAGELIPDTLGYIFANNPQVIEKGILQLQKENQRIIVNALEFGWLNIRGIQKDKVVNERDSRLKKLMSRF